MPEVIISASGTQHGLIINPDGSLSLSGAVTVSSLDEFIGRPDQSIPPSGTLIMGASGGTSRILLTDDDGVLQTAASVTVGSESVIVAGSVQTYNPIGVGSVLLVPGSLEVFQTTNADMQVQATQEGTWDINNLLTGSVRVVSQNQWTGVGSVVISGVVPVSVSAGSILEYEVTPISTGRNNPALTLLYVVSGTSTGVTGSEIGSVIQFIGAGSFVQVLSYSGNQLTNVGSWS